MNQIQIRENGGDVLLLSHRRLKRLMAFCLQYEFEDIITSLTDADVVEPGDWSALNLARRAHKLVRKSTGSARIAQKIAPKPPQISLSKDYRLFLPIFNNVHEVHGISSIANWRQRCDKAACFINEVWLHETIPDYLIEVLAEFDIVFLGLAQSTEKLAALTGKPCEYLPLATDVLRFAPSPEQGRAMFDVCNLGRRSDVTHAALVALADAGQIRYYFDSISMASPNGEAMTYSVRSPSEHRLLLSQILKSSRYFVANRSRIDQPEYPREHEEISSRFYEGAAAATVMIGEAPRSAAFEAQFGWADSVIHLPFDSPDVGDLIAGLDRDPERISRARRENLHQAAARHDWAHRFLRVHDVLGMEPDPRLLERKAKLDLLAVESRSYPF